MEALTTNTSKFLKKQHQSAMTRCLLVGPRCSKAAAFPVDLHMPQMWLLHTATFIMHISVNNLEASLVEIQQIVHCKTLLSMKTSMTSTNRNHSLVHSTCDNRLLQLAQPCRYLNIIHSQSYSQSIWILVELAV